MVTLAPLTAACLDPAQAALVLALVVVYRGPLPSVVAGAAAALLVETTVALAAAGYVWGELIAPRLVAALLQAVAAVLVVWAVRGMARGAGLALGIGRPDGDGDTAAVPTDRSASAPEVPRQLGRYRTVWHMRSHARHHTYKLHKNKTAALDCESL